MGLIILVIVVIILGQCSINAQSIPNQTTPIILAITAGDVMIMPYSDTHNDQCLSLGLNARQKLNANIMRNRINNPTRTFPTATTAGCMVV